MLINKTIDSFVHEGAPIMHVTQAVIIPFNPRMFMKFSLAEFTLFLYKSLRRSGNLNPENTN